MMTQFAQLYHSGLIRYTQSTFLELVTDTEVHRIDFYGKLSQQLRRGTYGTVSFHDDHVMLRALHVPLTCLLARATLKTLPNASGLLGAIREELYNHHDKWYDFGTNSWKWPYQQLAYQNLKPDLTRTGGIILDYVPIKVAQAVSLVCSHYDVEAYCYPPLERLPSSPSSPFQLLLVGDNYVIARGFFVSTMYGNPAAKLAPRFVKSPGL